MAEDADLLSELAGDQGHGVRNACGWKAWLASLPEDEADQWREAVASNDRFTIASIMRALKRREVEIGRSTIERHRLGQCKQCR